MSEICAKLASKFTKIFTEKKRVFTMADYFANIKQMDKAGARSKRVELRVETTAGASAIADAIDSLTGGSVKAVTMTTPVSSESGYGTGNLGRESVFIFKTSTGETLPFRLRGVLDDYVMQGGKIDTANQDVVDFATAMITNALFSDGQIAASLYDAYVVD